MKKERHHLKQVSQKRNLGRDGLWLYWRSARIHISLIVILLIYIFLILRVSFQNNNIRKNGLTTIAVITDIREVGGKGIRRCFYTFKVDNIEYKGWVDDDNLKLYNVISIKYLQSEPSKNRVDIFLEK